MNSRWISSRTESSLDHRAADGTSLCCHPGWRSRHRIQVSAVRADRGLGDLARSPFYSPSRCRSGGAERLIEGVKVPLVDLDPLSSLSEQLGTRQSQDDVRLRPARRGRDLESRQRHSTHPSTDRELAHRRLHSEIQGRHLQSATGLDVVERKSSGEGGLVSVSLAGRTRSPFTPSQIRIYGRFLRRHVLAFSCSCDRTRVRQIMIFSSGRDRS